MGHVLIWSLILIALLLAGFFAAAQVKKRLVRPDDVGGPGFTLSQLRELRRNGQMSEEEFEKAKQVILSAAKRAAEGDARPKQPPRPSAETENPTL